jgi:hypothetical protein
VVVSDGLELTVAAMSTPADMPALCAAGSQSEADVRWGRSGASFGTTAGAATSRTGAATPRSDRDPVSSDRRVRAAGVARESKRSPSLDGRRESQVSGDGPRDDGGLVLRFGPTASASRTHLRRISGLLCSGTTALDSEQIAQPSYAKRIF